MLPLADQYLATMPTIQQLTANQEKLSEAMFTLTKELTPIIQIFKSPQVQGLVKQYQPQLQQGTTPAVASPPGDGENVSGQPHPTVMPNNPTPNAIGQQIIEMLFKSFGAPPGSEASIFTDQGKLLLAGIKEIKDLSTAFQNPPSIFENMAQRVMIRRWQKENLITEHEVKSAEKALPIGEEHASN